MINSKKEELVQLKTGKKIAVRLNQESPYGTVRVYAFGIGGGAHRIYVKWDVIKQIWVEV